jgi:sulfite dehydrogenase (cytochrome) subunit B
MRGPLAHRVLWAIALTGAAALGGLAATQPAAPPASGPPAYAPPAETSRFADGPGLDKAQTYCLACHSADYVTTQPRGKPAAFWEGEVAKMRTAYGAQIPDDEVKAIVAYLTSAYPASGSP